MVAQGLTLGIHGINAHGHYNQMRACVCFPPSMDKLMGVKYNKGINPKQGPLKEGITRIWKDITSVWVKEKEEARKKDTNTTTQECILDTLKSLKKESKQMKEVEAETNLDEKEDEEKEEEEKEEEKKPEPPQIIVANGKVCLRMNDKDVASVDGLGINSHLQRWLDRVLQRKGPEKTKHLIESMEAALD